jgi:hypothetical protein
MYLSDLWKREKQRPKMWKKGLAIWILMGIDIDMLCVK